MNVVALARSAQCIRSVSRAFMRAADQCAATWPSALFHILQVRDQPSEPLLSGCEPQSFFSTSFVSHSQWLLPRCVMRQVVSMLAPLDTARLERSSAAWADCQGSFARGV